MPAQKSGKGTELIAAAVLTAALSACGGGSDEGSKPPVGPVTPPETPTEVLPAVSTDVGAMNVGGMRISDILKNFDGRITAVHVASASEKNITSCAVAPNADGSYTLIINPQDPNAKVEAADSCELQGTGDKVEQKVVVNSFLDTKPPQWKNGNVKSVDGTYGGNITLADVLPATDAGDITYNIDPSFFTRYPGNYYTLKDGKITWNAGAPAANIPVSVVDNVGNVNPTTGQINVTVVDTTPVEPPVTPPNICDLYPEDPICKD